MPYAAALVQIVSRRDLHIARLAAGQLEPLDPTVRREILAVVRSAGSITPQRVAHICGFPQRVVTHYIKVLAQTGELLESRTARGSPIVRSA